MRLPMKNGEVDMELTGELFDYAVRHGVNYFDTAWPYLGGKSETATGALLKKYPRDSFYLADKCPTWLIESPDDVDRIFDEQLKKCQTDYFDYYLVHSLDEARYANAVKHDVYGRLLKKKEEGKIKNLGFSFHDTPDVLEKILNNHKWDFVQLQINYVDWTLQNAKRQYELAVQHDLPVIVMEPLRGGNLAVLNENAVKVLKTADPNATAAAWGLRYVASLPNVLTVLSGMNVMDHLKDNISALTDFRPLTDKERETLERARQIYMSAGAIPCTGCDYCKDCPMGIPISAMFAAYNTYKTTDEGRKNLVFTRNYKLATPTGNTPDKCIECGLCEQHCPQHLPIREKLKEIAALYKETSQA
ncbi:MAG: aldo/keto reductase [Alphaproteobacteria bacterium]|nr:aldo/keto reductase [Alphaproteobacteria bacterium]